MRPWWETRGKKPNDRVGRLSVPPNSNSLKEGNSADSDTLAINGIFCRFKREVGRLEESELSF